MSKARYSAALAAASLALSACSSWTGPLFGPDQVIEISEVGRALDCAAASPDSSVQMFDSADAVRAWQQGSGAQLIGDQSRSEEHTSELQSLMRISYAVFCLKKKKIKYINK